MPTNDLVSRVSIVEARLSGVDRRLDENQQTLSDYRNRMEDKLDSLHLKIDQNRENVDDKYLKISRYIWLGLGALMAFEFILKYGDKIGKHVTIP